MDNIWLFFGISRVASITQALFVLVATLAFLTLIFVLVLANRDLIVLAAFVLTIVVILDSNITVILNGIIIIVLDSKVTITITLNGIVVVLFVLDITFVVLDLAVVLTR